MYKSQQEARVAGQQLLYDTARRCMWQRLGITPPSKGRCVYNPLKEDYELAMSSLFINPIEDYSLDSNNAVLTVADCKRLSTVCEKENNMYAKATSEISVDSSKVYIEKRLAKLYYEKIDDIATKYADPHPKSPKEMKEWLKSGNFRVEAPLKDEVYEENQRCFYWVDCLHWGKDKPDVSAKKKDLTSLAKAYQEALDVVSIKMDEESRMRALKDFESYAVH